MSEIYRVPPWIMLEYWELRHCPTDKPNTFAVVIFDENNISYEGKGVSISHAAKNAYRKRLRKINETSIPTEGSAPLSEDQAQENESPETGAVG